MRHLALSALVLLSVCGVSSPAATLTGAAITDFPLVWDTFPTSYAMLGLKEGSVFLNPNDEPLDYDLSAPGVYDFEIRLNKGTQRNMSAYDLALYFDGDLLPAIQATADVDVQGGTPPMSGSLRYLDVTLTSLRLSTFDSVDEVGDHSAGPDEMIDYVGSLQVTVIPEPSSLALLSMGAVVLLAGLWRRAYTA